jgi:hypothetical protein
MANQKKLKNTVEVGLGVGEGDGPPAAGAETTLEIAIATNVTTWVIRILIRQGWLFLRK